MRAELVEDFVKHRGVTEVRMERIGSTPEPLHLDASAEFFRAKPAVYHPLLKPLRLERPCSRLCHKRRYRRSSEGAESCLRDRAFRSGRQRFAAARIESGAVGI